jgi:protein phosphatase PTC7
MRDSLDLITKGASRLA